MEVRTDVTCCIPLDTSEEKKRKSELLPSFLAGELYKHLKKYGRFTTPMVKFYSAEIALAIEYLHRKSIVYRDLKPENVVIDAGVAQLLLSPTLTATHLV